MRPDSKGINRELSCSTVNDRSRAGPLIEPVPPGLVAQITGRDRSLFTRDIETNDRTLARCAPAARILVVGAAGSIGAAVVKLLASLRAARPCPGRYQRKQPSRSCPRRCGRAVPAPSGFRDVGRRVGHASVRARFSRRRPFRSSFNFAALKHVRSERDPFSLMRMIETNVFAVEDLVRCGERRDARLFSVSSDKAVFPTSLMGATKRWMERVLAQPSAEPSARPPASPMSRSRTAACCTRSSTAWRSGPAVAAPNDVRRYFISHTEAAELCLLARRSSAATAEIFVPKLDPQARRAGARRGSAPRAGLPRPVGPGLRQRASRRNRARLLRSLRPRLGPATSPRPTQAARRTKRSCFTAERRRRPWPLHRRSPSRASSPLRSRSLPARRRALAHSQSSRAGRRTRSSSVVAEAVPELAHLERQRSLDSKL